jgi:hypothetical protein
MRPTSGSRLPNSSTAIAPMTIISGRPSEPGKNPRTVLMVDLLSAPIVTGRSTPAIPGTRAGISIRTSPNRVPLLACPRVSGNWEGEPPGEPRFSADSWLGGSLARPEKPVFQRFEFPDTLGLSSSVFPRRIGSHCWAGQQWHPGDLGHRSALAQAPFSEVFSRPTCAQTKTRNAPRIISADIGTEPLLSPALLMNDPRLKKQANAAGSAVFAGESRSLATSESIRDHLKRPSWVPGP